MRRLLRAHLALFDAALRRRAAVAPLTPRQHADVLLPALAALLDPPAAAALRRIRPGPTLSDQALSEFMADVTVLSFRFPEPPTHTQKPDLPAQSRASPTTPSDSDSAPPPPPLLPLLALPSPDGRTAYLAAEVLASPLRARRALECVLVENLARWRSAGPGSGPRLIPAEHCAGLGVRGPAGGRVPLSPGDLYAALVHGVRPPPASVFRLAVDAAALGAAAQRQAAAAAAAAADNDLDAAPPTA
jgi:hypothetical protein